MVGKNIKKYREEKGLSQQELADCLNVTRQAVSNWENGKTQPDIETLHNISMTLEVTIEDLIYGSQPERKVIVTKEKAKDASSKGFTFGMALAMIISYVKWNSIGWAIFHGFLSWAYVIYYIIKY